MREISAGAGDGMVNDMAEDERVGFLERLRSLLHELAYGSGLVDELGLCAGVHGQSAEAEALDFGTPAKGDAVNAHSTHQSDPVASAGSNSAAYVAQKSVTNTVSAEHGGAPASVTAGAPSTARIKVADSGVFLALDVGEAGEESSVKWEELAALWRERVSMGLLPGVDVAWCEVQPMTAPKELGVDMGPNFSVVKLPGKPTTDHRGKEDPYQIITKGGRDTRVLTDEMRAKAQGLTGKVYELNLNNPRIGFLLGSSQNDALTNGPVLVIAHHEAGVRDVLNSIRAELGLGPFSAEWLAHTALCKLTGLSGDHAALREKLDGWPQLDGHQFPEQLSSLAEALGGRGEAPQRPDEDTLRAMRTASSVLREWWTDPDASPSSWKGVGSSDGGRVQTLDLHGCQKLAELPSEIRQLQSLTALSLRLCSLVVLPPEIGLLHALGKLDLTNCSHLTLLPPEIGQLKELTTLVLYGCSQLVELPPAIGQLQALTRLTLGSCSQLQKLPAELGLLHALDTLDLNEGCTRLTLAPFAKMSQPARTNVAAYARLLIVKPREATPGDLHAFLLEKPLAVPSFFKYILTDSHHADWLGYAVRETPDLARLTGPHGRRAIDVAVPECQKRMQEALFLLGRFEVEDGKLLHLSTTSAVAAAAYYNNPGAKPARVALKAMRGVEQVRSELEGRVGLDLLHVVGVKAVFADKETVDADGEEWKLVDAAAAKLGIKAEITPGLSDLIKTHFFPIPIKQETDQSETLPFAYVLVLDYANCTLKHTIDHEHIAGEDFHRIRYIASNLGQALDNVHTNGNIHADFKPHNAAFVGNDWKLLDFDVFCQQSKSFGSKTPSSGYCPPEMAKVLLAATNPATGKVEDTSLLKEYIASVAHDLWSFGVVLYHLCFGTPLWKTGIDDNIALNDLRTLGAASGSGPLIALLNKAFYNGERREASRDLKVATALLRKLLEPDAKKRLQHFASAPSFMKGVLDEPFFKGEALDAATLATIEQNQENMINKLDKHSELLTSIKAFSTENKIELLRTREALMKGIFEATEVQTPTAFIVLNEMLPDPPTEEEKQRLQMTEDSKQYIEQLNTATKWMTRLEVVSSNLAAGKVGEAFTAIKEGLGDLVTGEKMYLYLIDELTGEPVRAAGYPIEITTPSDIVHKLLPVMQVGLCAMSTFNGAAGVARMVGYPVPRVPKAWVKGARKSVDLLKQKSSVEQFSVVHEEVMGGSEESKSVRGHSLRVFVEFLKEHDPGLKHNNNGHFAGLQRIGDPNDGTALWTTLADAQHIKSAIEKRVIDREAERTVSHVAEAIAREGDDRQAERPSSSIIKVTSRSCSPQADALSMPSGIVNGSGDGGFPTSQSIAREVVDLLKKERAGGSWRSRLRRALQPAVGSTSSRVRREHLDATGRSLTV